MRLNVYALAWPVTALGPGRRAALWVAGCRKNCPGCLSPEMKPPDAGRPMDITVLLRKLQGIEHPLTGLSISGGEPVDQSDSLCLMLEQLRYDRPKWSVILYSGYYLEEIEERAPRLIDLVDVLIAGPYMEDVPSVHPLLGSGNQRLHYLSEKGRALKTDVDRFPPDAFDLALGPNCQSMLIGVSNPDTRRRVLQKLEDKR